MPTNLVNLENVIENTSARDAKGSALLSACLLHLKSRSKAEPPSLRRDKLLSPVAKGLSLISEAFRQAPKKKKIFEYLKLIF